MSIWVSENLVALVSTFAADRNHILALLECNFVAIHFDFVLTGLQFGCANPRRISDLDMVAGGGSGDAKRKDTSS